MKKSITSVALLTALVTSFNGCGNSSSNSNDKIDLAQYFEKDSRVNNMVQIYKNSQYPEPTITYYTDTVEVKDNLITHEVFGQRSFIIEIKENDLNITKVPNNINYSVKRYVNIGEEVSSYSIDTQIYNGLKTHVKQTEKCILNGKKESITLEAEDENLTYEGDIIVQICTAIGTQTYFDINESFSYKDIYHEFYAKDKGRIALINENCLTPHKNSNLENNESYYDIKDNSKECAKTNTMFHLLLE